MVTLSVVVMAHPKREAQVDHVLGCIGDVPVIWDEKNDRWDTGRRSMLAYDPTCTHHLVIQDDVLPCKDLIPGVIEAVGHIPADVPLCLYVGRRRPYEHQVSRAARRATETGASFITMHTLNWGPGIIVPTADIGAMITHCDRLTDIQNYDRRLSRYWELVVHKKVWYTWPSLLDHADGPSLVKGRLGTDREKNVTSRIAHLFLGEDRSALDVDWSRSVVDIPCPVDPRPPKRREYTEQVDTSVDPALLSTFQNTVSGRIVTLPSNSQRARRYRGLSNWVLVGGDL